MELFSLQSPPGWRGLKVLPAGNMVTGSYQSVAMAPIGIRAGEDEFRDGFQAPGRASGLGVYKVL